MRPLRSLTSAALLAALALPLAATEPDEAPDHSAAEAEAVAAAAAWLELVDEGKYAESWEEAAPYFRQAVERQQWIRSLEAVRTPLGEMRQRRLVSKAYTRALPGAPDGEYVVLQFATSFARKSEAVETVTPMRCDDGVFRVAGLFIK